MADRSRLQKTTFTTFISEPTQPVPTQPVPTQPVPTQPVVITQPVVSVTPVEVRREELQRTLVDLSKASHPEETTTNADLTVLEMMNEVIPYIFARKRELPKSVELDLLLHTLYSRLQIQYEKRIQIEEDIIAEILHLKHHLSELDLWKTRYHTQLQRYTGKDIYGKHVLFCERYF